MEIWGRLATGGVWGFGDRSLGFEDHADRDSPVFGRLFSGRQECPPHRFRTDGRLRGPVSRGGAKEELDGDGHYAGLAVGVEVGLLGVVEALVPAEGLGPGFDEEEADVGGVEVEAVVLALTDEAPLVL